MSGGKKMYSVKEVSDLLGVSRVTVFRWIKSGKVKASLVGKSFVISIDEPRDFNQFPQTPGMLVFGISMNRIGNVQSPKACFDAIQTLDKKIVRTQGIGLTFLYSDYLYMHSDEPAIKMRDRFLALTTAHKQGFEKILAKHTEYIPDAFSYLTWNQLLIDCPAFFTYFQRLKKLAQTDPVLQACLAADAGVKKFATLDQHQISFFLEECLVALLLTKRMIPLQNEYLHRREQWLLNCYPGKPLMTECWLFQKNPFKLECKENRYENAFYDLSENKLYNLLAVKLPSVI